MPDVATIKKQFPIFQTHPNLVYLDSGASAQKPQTVLDAMQEFYTGTYANIHRGVYTLSEDATELYEKTREVFAHFIHAADPCEIIFTRGTTEAINLVAYTWGETNIREGDEIVASYLEHHANFIPWQQLAKRKKAIFKLMPITNEGIITAEAIEQTITPKTKFVAVTQVSNVLGVMPPIAQIIEKAHAVGAKVLVDAAQSVAHLVTDVRALNCDFLACSGHKMYGPTGVGVLYGKKELLETMPPFLFGGSMIKEVKVEDTTWADLPAKFEGGTPPIAEVIGLAPAVGFLQRVGFETIRLHEKELLAYAFEKLAALGDITVFGPKNPELVSCAVSFLVKGVHAHDVATLLDEKEVAIRVGHHCAQPLMKHLGVPATCRASFGIYNSKEDVDALCEALKYAKSVFA